ncbi:MAG: DNA polymerase IV [Firmicutes bacterium]|nr:DNA polymerase IV [Bacillota bacterium]
MKDRLIFHIDVNNAYLSWTACELLKTSNVDIRKQVSVIAGDESKRHGVVLAKSPLAKKYGIVTGESIFSARKKYKNLCIYSPSHDIYKEYSNKLINYLSIYTPHLEQYSIDECFLDMSGMGHFFKDPIEFATKIKNEIKDKFGFTVNIGIGNNKLCAKIASDFEKPDKVHTLFKNEIESKLWVLPVEDLFMVGKKTKIKLKEMKINTIYDLAHTNKEKLILNFKSFGNTLYEYANGIDDTPVESEKPDLKGIGNSLTLPKDLEEIDDIKLKLLELSEQVGSRLRKDKKYACVITLYVKYSDFKTLTHQKRLKNPINTDEEIYQNVIILLKEIEIKPIRSLGIRLSMLVEEKFEQISLFNSNSGVNDNFENLQYTIDDLKSKYGKDIIKKAIRKDR